MATNTYDDSDPDNRPLTEEEKRLLKVQDQGMKQRREDERRAGQRFNLLDNTEHGNF